MLKNEFTNWDDEFYVLNNPLVKQRCVSTVGSRSARNPRSNEVIREVKISKRILPEAVIVKRRT